MAICDVNPLVHSLTNPPRYGMEGDLDYRRMYDEIKPDLVVISTPWEWHSIMAVDAMNRGISVACEVNPAMSLDEMWYLVDNTSDPWMTLQRIRRECRCGMSCPPFR